MSFGPDHPEFDRVMESTVRRSNDSAKQKLEAIIGQARFTLFRFTERLLLRHILILGATGSGKTNHAFYIILQALHLAPVSCIIIDVKQEYRKLEGLVNVPVRVLAVGDEPRVAFNPLMAPPGVEDDHWDRAFADVFTRAYGLSEPSRRILLDCLSALREAQPESLTLRQLENAVGSFNAESSKEQNSRRSLESRLHIINTGPVGRSLNSERALDFGAMEGKVTIFEVGEVDSLRDQRFLAELMLAQLWHHDRARRKRNDDVGAQEKLQRLIVVEEAHRYLSEERPSTQRGDRTLLELAIAEARRYGWGFLIIDQMPLLLSRYVWDNCGTVLAHRLTNLDSYEAVRRALGGKPLNTDQDVENDPLGLRLPEKIAIFHRYVDDSSGSAGVGFVMVPKVIGDGKDS